MTHRNDRYKVFISVNRTDVGIVTPSYTITIPPSPPSQPSASSSAAAAAAAAAAASLEGAATHASVQSSQSLASQIALCTAAAAGEIRAGNAGGGARSTEGSTVQWLLGGGSRNMEYARLALLVAAFAFIIFKVAYRRRPSGTKLIVNTRRSATDILLGRRSSTAMLDFTGGKGHEGDNGDRGSGGALASSGASLSPSSANAASDNPPPPLPIPPPNPLRVYFWVNSRTLLGCTN